MVHTYEGEQSTKMDKSAVDDDQCVYAPFPVS